MIKSGSILFKARLSNTCCCTPNTKPGTIGNAKDWAPVTLLGLTCLESSSDVTSIGSSSASLCVCLPYAGNNGAHVKSTRYTGQKLLALSKHNLLQASLYIILVAKRMEHILVISQFCFAAVAIDVYARDWHAQILLRTLTELTSKPFFFSQQMPVGMSKEIVCGPGNTLQNVRFENLTKTNDLAPLNKLLFWATFSPYQLN